MDKVHTTDVGTLIKLNTGEDLSTGVNSVKIVAKLGEAAAVDLTATVVETTKVQHQKTASTLNTAGAWDLQAEVDFDDGTNFRSRPIVLNVYASLA